MCLLNPDVLFARASHADRGIGQLDDDDDDDDGRET